MSVSSTEYFIAPSYLLKIIGSTHRAIRAPPWVTLFVLQTCPHRWANLPDNANRLAWSLAIQDVMYFLKWLQRKTVKHQKTYKTEFRYDSDYQILELTRTPGGRKGWRHFTLTLYPAHEKSEPHLPEVTNQVSNKTGWTHRQTYGGFWWEVQSKEETNSAPSFPFSGQSPRTSPPLPGKGKSEHVPVISGDWNSSVRAFPKSLRQATCPRPLTHSDPSNPPSPLSCLLFLIRPLELTRLDPSNLKNDFQVVSFKANDSWSPASISQYALREISNLILPPAVI